MSLLYLLSIFITFVSSVYAVDLNVCNPSGKCITTLFTIKDIQTNKCYTSSDSVFGSFKLLKSFNCSVKNCYVFGIYTDFKCEGQMIADPIIESYRCSRFTISKDISSYYYYQMIDSTPKNIPKSATMTSYEPVASQRDFKNCKTIINTISISTGKCYSTGSLIIPSIWFAEISLSNPYNPYTFYLVSYNQTNCQGNGHLFTTYGNNCNYIQYKPFNQNYELLTIESYNFYPSS
jgi:hypothetical protein